MLKEIIVNKTNTAILLVGHGGLPSDIPSELVEKFMRTHKARIKANSEITKQEIELDRAIRMWKRTTETDPYKTGLEILASELKKHLIEYDIKTAYNEFCYPGIEDAVAELAEKNYSKIIILTTMITRGGSHSETEIPEEIEKLRKKYQTIDIQYAWPYCMDGFAKYLSGHIEAHDKQVSVNSI